MLRAVLFDLDDTLLDHTGNQRRLARMLCERHPVFASHDPDEFTARSVAHLEDLHPRIVSGALTSHEARVERFRRLLREAGADASSAEDLAHWHRATYLEIESLVPGALELVGALHEIGARLAIVSNSTRDEQQRKLVTHGLAPYFDTLVVSGDHGISKPDPELFRIGLRRLGVPGDGAVMIGDSWDADIVGARNAGIRAIWFNRFGRDAPDGSDAPQIRAFDGTAFDLIAGTYAATARAA